MNRVAGFEFSSSAQQRERALRSHRARWGHLVPTERLRPVVADVSMWPFESRGGWATRDRLRKVRTQSHVSFALAERLLIDLGLEHLWFAELSDLYEAA